VSFAFWQRWLLVVSVVVVVFGLALAICNQSTVFDVVFNDRVNPVFWRSAQATPEVVRFQQWIYGVLGATVAGWGLLMAFITAYPFKRREPWSWTCLAASIGLWFVFDTTISAYFAVVINVAVNCALAVAVALPLAFTRKDFAPAPVGRP